MKALIYIIAFCTCLFLYDPVSLVADSSNEGDREIHLLIERLGSSVGVKYELAIYGSRVVPKLIDALSSNDDRIRSRAAETLGLIGDPAAIPALIKMADKKGDRYKSALDALGNIGGPNAAAYLIRILPNESFRNQVDIIRDLGLIGENKAVPCLCDIFENTTAITVRRQICETLGRFRDPRSRQTLQNAVEHDPNWDVYITAKKSLIQMAAGCDPSDQYNSYCKNPYSIYSNRSLIEIVVEKTPEPPEGAEEWVRRYHKAHPPHPKSPYYIGPTVHVFVLPVQYENARRQLLDSAKHPSNAENIVEILLEYIRHQNIQEGVGEKAMRLIIDIGEPAIPPLKTAIQRGDDTLKKNASMCLRQIRKSK